MDTLVHLNDGRTVSFGTARDGSGTLVNALRVFGADGSEITTGPVFFGTGTDVQDINVTNEFVALALPNGGLRIVARDQDTSTVYEIGLNSSYQLNQLRTFDSSANDATVPYITVYQNNIQVSDGNIAATFGQDLYLSDSDGMFLSATTRPGGFQSVNDSELVQIGNRILRVTDVNTGTGTNTEIRGQYYNRDGSTSGGEFVIATGLSRVTGHFDIEVTQLDDGRIAVAYVAFRAGDEDTQESAVYVTVLNANGTVAVAEQMVNTGDTLGSQDDISLYALDNGGFAVTYETDRGFTPNNSINVRFFDADGAQYDDFRQTGTSNGDALFVSGAGVVVQMDVSAPQELYRAPNPDDPGLTGDELILSERTLGELAEDAQTATLEDGRVVIVYDFTNLRGIVRILDPETDEVTTIGAPIQSGNHFSVAALADGGFVVAWNSAAQNTERGDVLIQVYNANGSIRQAATPILSGEGEHVQVFATAQGFAVHYVDDTGTLDDVGKLQFFGSDGRPLGVAFEYQPSRDQEMDMDSTLLTDGRMVVTWPGYFQIWNIDGSADTGVVQLPGSAVTRQPTKVAALDDGGFVTVHLGTDGVFHMSVFDANGVASISDRNIPLNAEPVFDVFSFPFAEQAFDIEINGDGQLVLAYHYYTDATNEEDVRFSIYDLSGGDIIAGQIATANISDDQDDVHLTRLDDGDVFLTFRDDTNVQFSSQSSINGVRIQGGTFPMPVPTPGADNLAGSNAADEIDLLAGNDTYRAGGGNDTVDGNAGNDSLSGDDGNDLLFGGDGIDTLRGGNGDDTLDGGGGGDVIDGGAGYDIADYGSATRSVRVDLQNPAISFNDAAGDTFVSIEEYRTGDGIDQLRGDSGDNVFRTGGVSDRLYGRAGDDQLFGEAGADAFYGGLGADTMTGGDDAGRRDRFIYFNAAESGVGAGQRDVITDFVAGEDRIELSRIDADLTQGFKQRFEFVGNAAFSGTGGELRYEQVGGNTIVQADRDGDGMADFEIELSGLVTLTESDFLI